MTTIYIDADACPVKDEVYKVAQRYGLTVFVVCNSWIRVPPAAWIRLEVVPEGPDRYMVASHGTMGWSSGPAQKAKALQEADDYCKQHGKQMEPISESDSGPGVFGKISTGEVHFRCIAASGK